MVRMTAKALASITSEPARAHAVELVMLGHLLNGRLIREKKITSESDFARVWRDFVVPECASRVTEWQAGMSAEIHSLKSEAGRPFNNVVGRIAAKVDDERFEVLIHGPDGLGSAKIKPANLKATARPGAIIFIWRHIVASPPTPYTAVKEAAKVVQEPAARARCR